MTTATKGRPKGVTTDPATAVGGCPDAIDVMIRKCPDQ
jgi:hypothetical protein